MGSLTLRLYSFLNWPDALSPCRLANLGFFYSGRGDVITCFVCRIEIEGCKTVDEVLDRHRRGSPDCTVGLLSTETSGESRAAVIGTPASLATLSPRRANDTETDHVEVNSTENQRFGRDAGTAVGIGDAAQRQTDAVDRSDPDFGRLRSEIIRLETFHDWPDTTARVVDPRELAEAGLFYTGQRDRVQCAFCRGFLRNWIRGDSPRDEHRKHFPDCPFVRGLGVGNVRSVARSVVSRDTRAESTSTSERVLVDEANVQVPTNGEEFNFAETSSSASQPPHRASKHPRFADVSSRIRSFDGKRVGQGQTVDNLAEAGFFHIGPDDNVRCFQCDGGLKNWRPTDDPWTEHARWFPRCPFLLANKDQSFIRNAQLACRRDAETPPTYQTSSSSSRPIKVEPREVNALMDSPSVQAIANMGFNRETIRRVIEDRLTTTGDNFSDPESLLTAVLNYEQTGAKGTQSSTGQKVAVKLFDEKVARSAASNVDRPEDIRPTSDSETLALMDENQQLKDARKCKVCMDHDVDTVFLPCGHLVCCGDCSPALRNCAICRALIRGTVKVFLG